MYKKRCGFGILLQLKSIQLRPVNTIERTFFNRDITNVSLGYRSCISFFCCMMESIARLKGFSNVDNLATAVIDDYFRRCEPFGDI